MVLNKLLFFIFCCSMSFFHQDMDLLKSYEKSIRKTIKKQVGITDAEVSFHLMQDGREKSEFYQVLTAESSLGYLMIKEVRACDLNGCNNKNKETSLEGEYYDVATLVNNQGIIIFTKVLNYFSDYGYEISSKRYLTQYKNKSVCQFAQQPLAVDGISGATISYNALIDSLNEFCDFLDDK